MFWRKLYQKSPYLSHLVKPSNKKCIFERGSSSVTAAPEINLTEVHLATNHEKVVHESAITSPASTNGSELSSVQTDNSEWEFQATLTIQVVQAKSADAEASELNDSADGSEIVQSAIQESETLSTASADGAKPVTCPANVSSRSRGIDL